ncbi:MAG: hypothetical protein ACYTGQ_20405 [Planctomycetota bacterium]|jgi:hypothetical protein
MLSEFHQGARRGAGIVLSMTLVVALIGVAGSGAAIAEEKDSAAKPELPACCQAKLAAQEKIKVPKACVACAAEGETGACVSCRVYPAGEDDAQAGRGPGYGRGQGRGQGHGPGFGGPPESMRDVHDTIHALLADHKKIQRTVKRIPGGVLTETTSKDPKVMANLFKHIAHVRQRMDSGQPMRHWDPLFVELFKHAKKIKMEVEPIEGGLRVKSTSDDPQVTMLIRQHAEKGVSEFVKNGIESAQKPVPLPKGYKSID